MNPKVLTFIKSNPLFKDSFWAVFGNGLGNALMLLAGILIARFLGKDLYGEYGVVKTTMFYVATFATFGLGLTSTKYVSDFCQNKCEYVKSVVYDSLKITLGFSLIIAGLLAFFSDNIAGYIETPNLANAFRLLAVVIVCRALSTTQIGVLSGLKCFPTIALNSVLSGGVMLVLCIPFTYYFSLKGSLSALLLSQMFNVVINQLSIRKLLKSYDNKIRISLIKELLKFSFPIALQESSYTVCHWSAIMFLTKYSSVGELGLYSASAQWNIIIMMIPVLLSNVILSYLSGSVNDMKKHGKLLKLMLSMNFISTIIPFLIIYAFSDFISSFYGESFSDMKYLIRVIAFIPIFEACANVFKSEFLALGKTWLLFSIKLAKDLMVVVGTYVVLLLNGGEHGATLFGYVGIIASFFYFSACAFFYFIKIHNKKC